MDPLLKELREKIDANGATVYLYAASGGTSYIGKISKPSRFIRDFGGFIEEAAEGLDPHDPDQPTPDEIKALKLSDRDSEPDPRYITLRDATVVFSAIESHRVPFLRLDLGSVDSWWIRPGWHPSAEEGEDHEADGDES